jgi:uncharacterized protein (TIGR00369 family)
MDEGTGELLDWIRSRLDDSLAGRLGVRIVDATADRVVGTMPVEGNRQPYGLLHGGASLALAETLGSVGAALHAGAESSAVGIEISGSHHRAVSEGTVTGVATALHLGRTLATYEIVLTDAAGRRVCTARLSCAIRPFPGSGLPDVVAQSTSSPGRPA